MPAEQQGLVYRTARGYGIRWYDETGDRLSPPGGLPFAFSGACVVP